MRESHEAAWSQGRPQLQELHLRHLHAPVVATTGMSPPCPRTGRTHVNDLHNKDIDHSLFEEQHVTQHKRSQPRPATTRQPAEAARPRGTAWGQRATHSTSILKTKSVIRERRRNPATATLPHPVSPYWAHFSIQTEWRSNAYSSKTTRVLTQNMYPLLYQALHPRRKVISRRIQFSYT